MTALSEVLTWLRCPLCHQHLDRTDKSLICPSKHTYDVARQGYVNLLGHGAPANADTAEMVTARDRFLSAGHYQPITDAVAAAVPRAQRVVEVGAGTGHHLAGVLERSPVARGLAVDVSVPACRRSARAHPRMASIVADTWAGLPMADGSVDAILCIFAPRNPSEFVRILSDDGVVVVVLPQPDHLEELRRSHALMNVGDAKLEKLVQSFGDRLELVSTASVVRSLELTRQEATDLVAMGPNAFHATASVPASRVRLSVTCLQLHKAN